MGLRVGRRLVKSAVGQSRTWEAPRPPFPLAVRSLCRARGRLLWPIRRSPGEERGVFAASGPSLRPLQHSRREERDFHLLKGRVNQYHLVSPDYPTERRKAPDLLA